jgi:tryptophanyl-tRNA synthetase
MRKEDNLMTKNILGDLNEFRDFCKIINGFMRILTGIQSSGKPHLGNILGAIMPAIELSKKPGNESFLFIADLHTLTSLRDGEQIRANTLSIAAAWLAFGFDTDKNFFYRQSKLAGYHTEIMWYLNCVTPYPMLANAHSFKDKTSQMANVNAGLFTYPVLQAADIVLYDAEIIPVGKDQQQHIEMTRDMAGAFNRMANKEIFVIPEAAINKDVMTIPGIDGNKMSKSLNNYLDVFLPEKDLLKQIKKIESDSTPLEDPKNPEKDITFTLYSLLASPEQIAEMRQNYLAGGYGYGHAKQALHTLMLEHFKEAREKFDFYINNPKLIEEKLEIGEKKVEVIAAATLARVREVFKF